MSESSSEHLIDQIYESALISDLWPAALGTLARTVGCDGGILFTADAGQNVKFVASPAVVPLMNVLVRDGWMTRNTRAKRLAPRHYSGFVSDLDLFTLEEMDHDPFYTKFLRANGMGWGAGTIIPAPSGDLIVFTVERAQRAGPLPREAVEKLDHLRPHLARAGLLAARLRLQQATNMVETLKLIGLPAAVLRTEGRILAINSLLDAMSKQFVFGANDRLVIRNKQANDMFLATLSKSDTITSERMVHSIPIPAFEEHAAAVAHIVPIRGSAADVFLRASAILVVTPLCRPERPPEAVLNGLFDLTPAEARVTRGLVSGHSVHDLANMFGVSVETVRVQLKSTLAKTGTHRQADLVGLIAGANLPLRSRTSQV